MTERDLKVGHPWNAESQAVRNAVLEARRAAAAAGWPEVPSHTSVADFFAGRSVLLTGGTGFLGRLLLELILRTCPDVKKVYVVIRPKRGVAVQDRLLASVADPLFDRLRAEQPGALEKKVQALSGEITEPRLGLSEDDAALVCREVSVFLNVAASVRFTEPVKNALDTNVRSAKEAVDLAKAMTNLKVMVHVSTAYTNTNQPVTEERFYPPDLDWRTVLRAAGEIPDPDTLTNLGPKLLGFQPNSYTFSKALAEAVINDASTDIPVLIVRPSVVIGTDTDPIPGWIDNLYGFAAFWVLASKGILRVTNTDKNVLHNLIPGDVVAKTILLATWAKGIGINLSERTKTGYSGVEVVNSVSLKSLGVQFIEMQYFATLMGEQPTIPRMIRSPYITFAESKLMHILLFAWQHIVFGCVLDLLARLTGRRPRLLDIYRKSIVGVGATSYFASRQFLFRGDKQWRLQSLVLPSETKDYCYMQFLTNKDSVENYLRWRDSTITGIAKYCLHEKMDRERDFARIKKLRLIENVIYVIIVLTVVAILWMYFR